MLPVKIFCFGKLVKLYSFQELTTVILSAKIDGEPNGALGLGCARLAGMGRTLAVLGRLCGIFTFWLELFHRKPPNRRISGLVPAICRYRIPSKAVAIYVF